MALTGRYDFRKTWTGKIVLRVEEEVAGFWSRGGQLKKRWRDANLMDLTARELRVLMDSRLRPLLMAQYAAPTAGSGSKQSLQPEAPAVPQPASAAQMPAASSIASLDVLRKSRTGQAPASER